MIGRRQPIPWVAHKGESKIVVIGGIAEKLSILAGGIVAGTLISKQALGDRDAGALGYVDENATVLIEGLEGIAGSGYTSPQTTQFAECLAVTMALS